MSDYRSNLTAPDLRPHFKHLHWRPMGHTFGHLCASDWSDKSVYDPVFGLYKRCGFWTHDEAAILYNVAKSIGGAWVDVGAHTGWTTAHIATNSSVTVCEAIDPMFAVAEFADRAHENLNNCGLSPDRVHMSDLTFNDWIEKLPWTQYERKFSGFCIDGDHSIGEPVRDAENALAHLEDTGVIIFHDGIGWPVRDAVRWLMDNGFSARMYHTPHVVFVCWRGDFVPPDHIPDPHMVAQNLPARMPDFAEYFGRLK